MTWAEYYDRYFDWKESTQYSRLFTVSDFGPDDSPSDQIADCIFNIEPRTATGILRRAISAGVRFQTAEIEDIISSGNIEDPALLDQLIHVPSDNYTGEQLSDLLDYFDDPEPVYDLIDQICSKPTHFTEEEVLDLVDSISGDALVNKLLESAETKFTKDGLNRLCDALVPEKIIRKISRQSGIPYHDPDEPMDASYSPVRRKKRRPSCKLPDEAADAVYSPVQSKPQERSLLSFLFSDTDSGNTSNSRRRGRCTGDCANCPPHYGYRYGRWYYGHGHMHGCELSGNGGITGKCNRD